MAKTKKELLASAPWRGQEEEKFKDAKLKATRNQSGSTMHLHRKKNNGVEKTYEDDSITELDPQLRYSFQRNYQVKIDPFACFLFVLCFRDDPFV